MKQIDDLLKQALTPSEEPDFWLNQKILSMAKEATPMKKKHLKPATAVALSAAVVLSIGSVSIYAARQFLKPEHVAEQVNDSKLTKAFKSDGAITINETQSYGGYDVTLLGIVSGKSLSEYEITDGGGIHDDRTYAVVAIGKSDQEPMPSASDDSYGEQSFFVSPLIQGLNPAWYNAFTFQGGYTEIEENGILYRIAECDNIEIFADREIYMCVSDSMSYNNEAYTYDEDSGRISRNENYDGLNALFHLPLDASKADPDAAAEYIKKIDEGSSDEPETETELSEEELEITEFMEKITAENLNEYAKPIESTRQVITPDEDGTIHASYELEDASGSGSMAMSELFPDQKVGMGEFKSFSHSGTLDSLLIETYTLNEDGTVTFLVYMPK